MWFPTDFLTKRSPVFQQYLSEPYEHTEQRQLVLVDVSTDTLVEFYRWSMMESPQLRPNASFEEVDALAEFAEKYKIHALEWQTSDRIRQQLHSGLWTLRPEVISLKCERFATGSWLLDLYSAAIGTIAGNAPASCEDIRQWRSAVAKASETLGPACVEALLRGPDRMALREGGSCRFHDHGDMLSLQENIMAEWLCPFRDRGCFMTEGDCRNETVKMRTGKKQRKP